MILLKIPTFTTFFAHEKQVDKMHHWIPHKFLLKKY